MFRALIRPFVAIYSFVQLVRSPEGNLDNVVGMLNSLIDADVVARIRRGLPSDPQVEAALVARPRIAPVDMESLLALPEGTLGHAWASFMRSKGFSLEDLAPQHNGEGDFWISTHMRETHDLTHLLTGFDTDIPGEMGVQGFNAAQLPGLPVPYLLFAGVLLNCAGFQGPEAAKARITSFMRGYALGQQSRLLFGLDWSQWWSRPLAEVRAELGLSNGEPQAMGAAA